MAGFKLPRFYGIYDPPKRRAQRPRPESGKATQAKNPRPDERRSITAIRKRAVLDRMMSRD